MAHLTPQQVAAMKYKKAGFKERPKSVDVTKRLVRFRLREPREFQKGSFRTKDIGKPGNIKAVIARPKGMRTTKIQSVLVPR